VYTTKASTLHPTKNSTIENPSNPREKTRKEKKYQNAMSQMKK
jgi:hypothetical protein